MSNPSRPYLSNGQVLQKPPFSARVRSFFDGTYVFFGLYVTTLFSLDAYAAAEASAFNISNRKAAARLGGGGGGGSGGSGGGGGGGGSGSGGGKGRKMGRVDDVRGPECNSCG